MRVTSLPVVAILLALAMPAAALADDPDSHHPNLPPDLQRFGNWALYTSRVPQPRPAARRIPAALRAKRRAGRRPGSPPAWLTFHGNLGRTAWNPSETVLNTSNVNPRQFGMLYSVPVDGEVYAEPLFIPQVNVAGKGTHDVLLVATEGDSVYAFDAESGAALWKTTYVNPPAVTTFNPGPCKCSNIAFQQGITGTPAVDPATLIAYFVTKTTEVVNNVSTVHYRLHGLNVTNGSDVAPPTDIQASVRASDGTKVSLNATFSIQRPGIALANGMVYVTFGSGADKHPSTTSGWVIAFNESNLAQLSAFSDETGHTQIQKLWYGPTGPTRLAGIWMSGSAPVVDSSGNVYVQTGNGAYDGVLDWGISVLKLSPTLSKVVDYFTPVGWSNLSNNDEDLSSAGVMALPQPVGGKNVLLAGGKAGATYLLDEAAMGEYNGKTNRDLFNIVTNGGLWGTIASYVGPDGNTYVIVPGGGPMTQWEVTSNASLQFISQSNENFSVGDDAGSEPVISSNGTAPGSAIVWSYSRVGTGGPATLNLRAFDATNLSNELIELPFTNWQGGGELLTPTVANGMVFTAGEGNVSAYGLL